MDTKKGLFLATRLSSRRPEQVLRSLYMARDMMRAVADDGVMTPKDATMAAKIADAIADWETVKLFQEDLVG